MTKKIIQESKYLRFVQEGTWEYVERTTGKDVVYIIPLLLEKGEYHIILAEEYRIPVHNNVLSFPAGLVGDVEAGEDIKEAARRELEEETGYRAKIINRVMVGPISPGLSDETLHFYLAENLEKVSEGGGDKSENITVHKVLLSDAPAYFSQQEEQGKLVDPKVCIGLYLIDKLVMKSVV